MKSDPNIADRNEKALRVACAYCGAGIGMQCWTIRSLRGGLGGDIRRYPHHQRIKASWRLANEPSQRKV